MSDDLDAKRRERRSFWLWTSVGIVIALLVLWYLIAFGGENTDESDVAPNPVALSWSVS